MKYGYLDKEVKSLVAERDRLAAENTELKYCAQQFEITAKGCVRALENEKKELIADLAATNATVDRLREVVRKKRLWTDRAYDSDCMHQVHNILYPPETPNEDR